MSMSFFQIPQNIAEDDLITEMYKLVVNSKDVLNQLNQTSKSIYNSLARNDAAPDLLKKHADIAAKVEDGFYKISGLCNDVNDLAADAGAEIKWRHS